jgi:hypothetical protein
VQRAVSGATGSLWNIPAQNSLLGACPQLLHTRVRDLLCVCGASRCHPNIVQTYETRCAQLTQEFMDQILLSNESQVGGQAGPAMMQS